MAMNSSLLVPFGRPPSMAASAAMKRLLYTVGKLCTVGPKNVAEGIETCCELRSCGISCTLGKFSKEGDDPVSIVKECIHASTALEESVNPAFYLSIKPPALRFREEHAAAITAAAIEKGHGVHFDSHRESDMDRTLLLLEITMRCFGPGGNPPSPQFGVTLPSRWRRSMKDAGWAARHAVRSRIVKGEFKSGEEMDPSKGFLAIVDRLTGSVPEIAVATHDFLLARQAIEVCRKSGTNVCLELLFGMPSGKMLELAKEMEVPLVFYVPYGDSLFLYGLGHLLQNPHKLTRPGLFDLVATRRAKTEKICTFCTSNVRDLTKKEPSIPKITQLSG